MAFATSKVAIGLVDWGDDGIIRGLAGTATTYYPGCLMCLLTGAGYGFVEKADDQVGYTFDGINAETQDIVVNTGDPAFSRKIHIRRPWRFQVAIAAAVEGDEGKQVYVLDDQTVAYATTNSVLVGVVDAVLSPTTVLVAPWWVAPRP